MRFVMLSALVVLALTACGGGGDDDSSDVGRVSPPPINCKVDPKPCR